MCGGMENQPVHRQKRFLERPYDMEADTGSVAEYRRRGDGSHDYHEVGDFGTGFVDNRQENGYFADDAVPFVMLLRIHYDHGGKIRTRG